MKINIVEIFRSIQGEGLWSGTPMTFVRFGGCNVNCEFCDTGYDGFNDMPRDEVLEAALQGGTDRVCITGGEPGIQKDSLTWLVNSLQFQGKKVHIETNATIPFHYPDAWITVSPKPGHPVKIWWNVVSEWKILVNENGPLTKLPPARDEKYDIVYSTPVFLQPVDPRPQKTGIRKITDYLLSIPPALRQIEMIQSQRPDLRLSLQLHKILGVK